jgi:hypothetical protein
MRGQFASKVASLEPFDHAIVYVPSLDLFLDGTAENAGLSELPIMDRGALGLLVNQGNSRLTRVPYPKPEENIVYRTVRGQLDKEGGARLDLDMHVKGFQAPEWRRRYGAESTREERLTEDIAAQVPGFRLAKGPLSTVSSGLDDITRPVELRVKGSVPNFGRRQDSELSIPVTTSLRLTPTYASLSRRKQDVWLLDFSSVDDTYVIDLPPGSKVTGLPPSASVTSEFGSYRLEVRRTPGRVTVRSRIAIFAPRVVPAKYSAWKAFCAEVDESLSHRLTVRP